MVELVALAKHFETTLELEKHTQKSSKLVSLQPQQLQGSRPKGFPVFILNHN
jgi:hypothetical protein